MLSIRVCTTAAATAVAARVGASGGSAQAPPAVVVERVEVRQIESPEQYTARVEAIESVDIVARVEGFLENVAFESGEEVAAGDLLFAIEADQYQAQVASANAAVAQAAAAAQEAARALARTEALAKEQSVARATLDEARANAEIADANLQAAEAGLRHSRSFGVLPFAVATGAGAGARQAVGVTVVGGMLAATLIGLFIIPSLFTVIQGLSERTTTSGSVRRLVSAARACLRPRRH